jgi:hypothetical protein
MQGCIPPPARVHNPMRVSSDRSFCDQGKPILKQSWRRGRKRLKYNTAGTVAMLTLIVDSDYKVELSI